MNQVRVGIGVIIFKDNKILMGKRKNSHGSGSWAFPGGHLDFSETPENCAIRETMEETGMKITEIKRGPWTNDFFTEENKHYITLFMLARTNDEPHLMEPEKCEKWEWFDLNNLPKPLFLTIQNLLASFDITSCR